MAFLTSGSIHQLLAVLELTRGNVGRGIRLPSAYHEAVREVATQHSVTYQTIGDFRRRLGFSNVDEYIETIRTWLSGESDALQERLISRGDASARSVIASFFQNSGSLKKIGSESTPTRGESFTKGDVDQRTPATLEEVRIRISPDLQNRIHLAQIAKLGRTFEETAVALLEKGFDAEKHRIKQFLSDL
jgi:hypothetical protein